MRTLFLALIMICFSSPAFSAKAKTKKKVPVNPGHEEQTISVKIPESELDVGSRISEGPNETLSRAEVGISFWSPSHFSRTGRGTSLTEFRTGSLPRFSVSRLGSLAEFPRNGAGIYWVVGAAYAQLERTASFTGIGASTTATETLALASLRLGAAYQGPRFLDHLLQPFASLSVLPTYALASQTQLEDRVSAWGFPFEASMGLQVRPGFMKDFLSLHDGAIGLGAHAVFGNIEGSSLNGLGIQGTISATL